MYEGSVKFLESQAKRLFSNTAAQIDVSKSLGDLRPVDNLPFSLVNPAQSKLAYGKMSRLAMRPRPYMTYDHVYMNLLGNAGEEVVFVGNAPVVPVVGETSAEAKGHFTHWINASKNWLGTDFSFTRLGVSKSKTPKDLVLERLHKQFEIEELTERAALEIRAKRLPNTEFGKAFSEDFINKFFEDRKRVLNINNIEELIEPSDASTRIYLRLFIIQTPNKIYLIQVVAAGVMTPYFVKSRHYVYSLLPLRH